MNRKSNYGFNSFIGKKFQTEVTEKEIFDYYEKYQDTVHFPVNLMAKEYNPLRINIFLKLDNTITKITIG